MLSSVKPFVPSSVTKPNCGSLVISGASLMAVMDVEIVAVLSDIEDVSPLLVVSTLTRISFELVEEKDPE